MDYNHSLRSKTAEPSAMSVPPRLLRGSGQVVRNHDLSRKFLLVLMYSPVILPSAMSWTSWSARLSSVALNPKASCTTTSADKLRNDNSGRQSQVSLPRVQMNHQKTSLVRKELREVFCNLSVLQFSEFRC